MAEVLRPLAWSDHSATRPSVWSLLFQIERWRWRVSIASFICISSLFFFSPIKSTCQFYAKLGNFQSATAQQELWSQEAVSSNHGTIFGLHKKHGFISLVEENCDWKCKMSDVHRQCCSSAARVDFANTAHTRWITTCNTGLHHTPKTTSYTLIRLHTVPLNLWLHCT